MGNHIVVNICGEDYTFIADESASYMQRVASYVSQKMDDVLESAHVGRADAAVLSATNITDELFKEQATSEQLRRQIKQYLDEASSAQSEVSELKRELARLQQKTASRSPVTGSPNGNTGKPSGGNANQNGNHEAGNANNTAAPLNGNTGKPTAPNANGTALTVPNTNGEKPAVSNPNGHGDSYLSGKGTPNSGTQNGSGNRG